MFEPRVFLNGEAMWRLIVCLLQIMCLTVFLLIFVDLADLCVDKWKIGPPPVPLDVEGHTAPYSDPELGP
jgi:hypothetical protein